MWFLILTNGKGPPYFMFSPVIPIVWISAVLCCLLASYLVKLGSQIGYLLPFSHSLCLLIYMFGSLFLYCLCIFILLKMKWSPLRNIKDLLLWGHERCNICMSSSTNDSSFPISSRPVLGPENYQWVKQTGSLGTLHTITKINKLITCCLDVFFGSSDKGGCHWWAWEFCQLCLNLHTPLNHFKMYNSMAFGVFPIPYHCHILVPKHFPQPKGSPLSRLKALSWGLKERGSADL